MDLISRQAAIDALDEQIGYCNNALGSFTISMKDEYAVKVEKASLEAYREMLECLPSAQPEPCDVAVSAMAVEEMLKNLLPERGMWEIEGDEAKTAICETIHDALEGLWKMPFVKPDSNKSSLTQKGLDTISRQAAIEINRSYHGQMPNEVNHRIWKEINELPSAQPAPCEFCKHNNIADDKACLMCSAERRTDE